MKSNIYKRTVHDILYRPNAWSEMENFILKLSKKGYSKKDIYNMLLEIHTEMPDNKEYNLLGDTLDRFFVGWTNQDDQILPDETV